MSMERSFNRVPPRTVEAPSDNSMEAVGSGIVEKAFEIAGAITAVGQISSHLSGLLDSRALRLVANMRPMKVARVVMTLYSVSGVGAPTQQDFLKALHATHAVHETSMRAKAKEATYILAENPETEWETFASQIVNPVQSLRARFHDDEGGQRAVRSALFGLFTSPDNVIEQRGWADNPDFWKKLQEVLGHRVGVSDILPKIILDMKRMDDYIATNSTVLQSPEYAKLRSLCGDQEEEYAQRMQKIERARSMQTHIKTINQRILNRGFGERNEPSDERMAA